MVGKISPSSLDAKAHFIIESQRSLDRLETLFTNTQEKLRYAQQFEDFYNDGRVQNLTGRSNQHATQIVLLRLGIFREISAFQRLGGDMENLAHGIYPRSTQDQNRFLARLSNWEILFNKSS